MLKCRKAMLLCPGVLQVPVLRYEYEYTSHATAAGSSRQLWYAATAGSSLPASLHTSTANTLSALRPMFSMSSTAFRRAGPRASCVRSFSSAPIRRTTQLKQMFQSNELEYLMEAHNGLSAKIVEEVGFKGIWASGLSMSASLGVRDSNEASWTQVCASVQATSPPPAPEI